MSARPVPASQAEKARIMIGRGAIVGSCRVREKKDRRTKRASIIPSMHRRAEIKWVRWIDRPRMLNIKAEFNVKWAGVI